MLKDDLAILNHPLDTGMLLRKSRGLRRKLRTVAGLEPIRVAVLGGSTTAEVIKFIDVFLLSNGFDPEFYESGYNRFFEDAMFDNEALDSFDPQFIYIHTSSVNIHSWPDPFDSEETVSALVESTYEKYESVWKSLKHKYNATIIQNNFESPFSRPLGNYDATIATGRTQFVNRLNAMFADYARQDESLILHDLHYQASWFGLEHWYDKKQWYAYKYAMNLDVFPLIGESVSAQIRAVLGKSKKCLVCDLDNTLWGGVVGDDGVDGIRIGNETPEAEAYREIQEYVRDLKARGVILAVCSKNEKDNAESGFSHPDSVLNATDFSSFKANWQSKDRNIGAVAEEINIGKDALVFMDDNPVERKLVADNQPEVCVPTIGDDPSRYIELIDKSGYFEITSLNNDDQNRSVMYSQNKQREEQQSIFSDYSEFLVSLEMKAEIAPFSAMYLPRISQLTNKTNQYNLTTKRMSEQELTLYSESSEYTTLYGRLADIYGDNGLVSVVLAHQKNRTLHVDLWLMSCRVIKRDFEWAMFFALKKDAIKRGCDEIIGYFIPTKKNKLVSKHYEILGFSCIKQNGDGSSVWCLSLLDDVPAPSIAIEITNEM